MEYFDKTRPIYIQIYEKYKREIIAGYIKPGSRLQSVRDLAEELCVNPNTMQKALAKLEQDNLVFIRRNFARYITEDTEQITKIREEEAKEQTLNYIKYMKDLGFAKTQIPKYVRKIQSEDEEN